MAIFNNALACNPDPPMHVGGNRGRVVAQCTAGHTTVDGGADPRPCWPQPYSRASTWPWQNLASRPFIQNLVLGHHRLRINPAEHAVACLHVDGCIHVWPDIPAPAHGRRRHPPPSPSPAALVEAGSRSRDAVPRRRRRRDALAHVPARRPVAHAQVAQEALALRGHCLVCLPVFATPSRACQLAAPNHPLTLTMATVCM